MCTSTLAAPVENGTLDKLADLRQNHASEDQTTRSTRLKLQRRARAKYVSLPLVRELAELDSPLAKSYRNSLFCCDTLEQADGTITAKYCKARWCTNCNRIRTGQAINKYQPQFRKWGDPFFVTLTVPNVTAEALSDTIDEMIRLTWRTVCRRLKRSGIALKGLRKLEITYNAGLNTFHPHFHVIVDGQEAANALLEAWLDRNPKAVRSAQDVRPADPGSIRELLKYFTKLVDKNGHVSPVHLDVMFRAMHRRRVFQPIGFRVLNEQDDEGFDELEQTTEAITRPDEHIVWTWSQDLHDWVDESTGDVLTGFEPSDRDRAFVGQLDLAPP